MENNFVTRDEFKALEKRVGSIENRQTKTETKVDNLEQKLDKIDSNTTWILRLIIGAFIMAVIGLVLKGGM
ncbi:hemolysin XhlA family protein [Heyndrickxia sp. NPDC080065]|uniref:hemolysin XhlA family protein n=1 Tax=Heyndrickxia sp. NPDC080065 TaxID=3390568 RepID=UPI003D034FC6